MKRIFVVGCPRSGTTLVQSIVGKHSGFVSFPEIGVFTRARPDMRLRKYKYHLGPTWPLYYCARILPFFGFSLPRLKTRIIEFLELIDLADEQKRFIDLPNRLAPILSTFVDVLDVHAEKEGWIDKSPTNVFCLDVIEKYVPDALVIHVIRDGEATLASIADAARRYESWNSRYLQHANNIERLVALWNRATAISLKYANKPNHFLVRHEALTQNPEVEVQKIAEFLGIPYSDDLLRIDASPYITPEEPWKKNMGHAIKPQKSKFKEVFTDEEQNYIRKNLRPIENFTAKSKAVE